MGRYRKKPLETEAMQWNGGDYEALAAFCGNDWTRPPQRTTPWGGPDDDDLILLWNKLELQWLQCPKDHWIIRGVQGELYRCDPDVFAMAYEAI